MLIHRPADERGRTSLDWLESRHTFSFSTYYDADWLSFGPLRVINDDHVVPGRGFGMHGHRDMEILTWVIEGKLAHRDSLNHEGAIEPGMAQVMTAGRGILHSEFNPSEEHEVHLLQIWIKPRETGLEPRYEDRRFDADARRGKFAPIASPDGRGNSLAIEQDAVVAVCDLPAGESVTHEFAADRLGWIQIARGNVTVNDELTLEAGDGVGIRDEPRITLLNTGDEAAQILLFDMIDDEAA